MANMMYIRDLGDIDERRAPPLPKRLSRNAVPRPVRELTDMERRALCREAENLNRQVQAVLALVSTLPIYSETLERIDDELRTNEDGSVLPMGTDRHPASDEFEEIESAFQEVVAPLLAFYESRSEIDELLITLRVKLEPWTPQR